MTLIQFFKKPWWVGPLALVAGMAVGHPGKSKAPGWVNVRGSEIVNSRGTLPRNGSVTVTAACPAGKRAIGGGYAAPSAGATTDLSILGGNSAWRVDFRSVGGSGEASVYAVCMAAK
jgi:hypothetical protein